LAQAFGVLVGQVDAITALAGRKAIRPLRQALATG
jgi:hypothetical protein